MLALVVWSREKSESKMAEGKCVLSKELRKSHLAVELCILKTGDPSSKDILEKCRDTCKEADKLLKTVIEKHVEVIQRSRTYKIKLTNLEMWIQDGIYFI